MTDAVIQVISAFLGTLGFSVLFNIRGKKLWLAALGGMLSWALFLALGTVIKSEALCYLLVSMCTTAYSEILARVLKTPAATFSIVTLIPLIPGGALYRTTTLALSADYEQFVQMLVHTVRLAVALSLGIVIVTAVFRKKHKK